MPGENYIEINGHKGSFGDCPECLQPERHCVCVDFTAEYSTDEEDDWEDDDLCCYDPRYKHGDYCHCKAYQEAQDREEKWGWLLRPIDAVKSIPFRLSTWWWKFKRNNLPRSVECDNCDHKHWFVGDEPKCPKCGNYNLPF